MNFRLKILLGLIRLRARGVFRKYQATLLNPEAAQKKILKDILKLAGQKSLPSKPTEFVDYTADRHWTSEAPRFYESTSGSGGIKKKIPYNPSLLASFQNMFLIWLYDISENVKLKTGKTFISLSPQLQSFGMESEMQYLDPWLQRLLAPFMVAEPKDFVALNGEEFMQRIARKLALCEELEVISIWSPSYFFALLESLRRQKTDIVPLLSAKRQWALLQEDWAAFWPNLRFFSVWGDAWAENGFRQLREVFPKTLLQKKGLLATEAPLTLPLVAAKGGLPLWNEVYLEYISPTGEITPVSHMQPGAEGEVLISTKGGLLRYRLGDFIRCEKIYKKSPVISFQGRGQETCDLAGEKLDARVVRDVFQGLLQKEFMIFGDRQRACYVVFTSENVLAVDLEERLQKIYHYKLARQLGQLNPIEVQISGTWSQRYMQYYQSQGLRLGDIKLKTLSSDQALLEYLTQPP